VRATDRSSGGTRAAIPFWGGTAFEAADGMRKSAQLHFVLVVTLAGAGLILRSLLRIPDVGYTWLLLAALTWAASSFPIRIPGVQATIYVSETFVFAQVLLFGFAPAVLTLAIDGLLISWRRRYKQVRQYCFNVAEPAISVSAAAWLFFWLLPVEPLALAGNSPGQAALVLPTLLMGAGYFLVNSWLATLAVALDTSTSPYRLWRSLFLWTGLNALAAASLGLVLAVQLPIAHMEDFRFLARAEDFAGLAVIGPLLLISYLTFRSSTARVEDANRHLTELNKLYLSTVETLAMAIDAKDQITHGHIRRVQTYAVALGKELGIKDEKLMKAIEAAALLHDMGKLSVPEFILNKPGKLSPAEYERMKLHAPIGASILSQIDFPYPVAPIVRHHHENWDGSGYPDGLAGEAIPIGARIMSVVDCFDALTADRPYRSALPEREALDIIVGRRGTMYDPAVVDAFLAVHADIRLPDTAHAADHHALIHQPRAPLNDSPPDDQFPPAGSPSAAQGILLLCEVAEALAGRTRLDDVAEVLGRRLKRIVPAPLVVFYIPEPATGDLVAAHASGPGEERLEGLRIAPGSGLSGWVAVNRTTILNASPALDFGRRLEGRRPHAESALSAPLIYDGALVGVLTLYAAVKDAFTDDHRRIMELAARQVAAAIAEARRFEQHQERTLVDERTGLPNAACLAHLLASRGFADTSASLSFGVLCLAAGTGSGGKDDIDREMRDLAVVLQGVLRVTDLAFRYGARELIVLLPDAGPRVAKRVADRILQAVGSHPATAVLATRLGMAFSPADGAGIDELLQEARRRARSFAEEALAACSDPAQTCAGTSHELNANPDK